MAKVSFKTLHQNFWMEDIHTPRFRDGDSSSWEAVYLEVKLSVSGRNLQYDVDRPSSGTVTRVTLDLDPYGNGAKMIVSGLHAEFGRLNWSGLDGDMYSSFVYAMLLEGDDTVQLGNKATNEGTNFVFAADGTWATTFCGDDKIRGDAGTNGAIYGDLIEVKDGYTRYGGNDDIRLTKALNATVVGDAERVGFGATLVAGDDYIKVSKAASVSGDVSSLNGHLAAGDDTIIGSSGSDALIGDASAVNQNTSIRGGNDVIRGGGGNDYLFGDVSDIFGNGQVIEGGRDKLYGDGGKDNLWGNDGKDSLYGGSGNDNLHGEQGDDVLRGDAGNDTLEGGAGADRLTGDAGKDRFLFSDAFDVDVITDFKHGEDKILLGSSFWIGSDLDASEFVARKSGHAAGDGQFIIYEKKTGKLWYDFDDDGPNAAIHFATLSNKPANLSYHDFDGSLF